MTTHITTDDCKDCRKSLTWLSWKLFGLGLVLCGALMWIVYNNSLNAAEKAQATKEITIRLEEKLDAMKQDLGTVKKQVEDLHNAANLSKTPTK